MKEVKRDDYSTNATYVKDHLSTVRFIVLEMVTLITILRAVSSSLTTIDYH